MLKVQPLQFCESVDSQGGTAISHKFEETSHMESNDLGQWRAQPGACPCWNKGKLQLSSSPSCPSAQVGVWACRAANTQDTQQQLSCKR